MPIINVTMGPTEKELKEEIIKNLTKTLVETTNIPAQAITVVIDEKSFDNIGIAGLQLSKR